MRHTIMPYRDFKFEEGQPFHVISRAVEERKIFENEADCHRFIFQIYAANLGKPNLNINRLEVTKAAQNILRGKEVSDEFVIKEHSPLVYILDFSLNITHYHLHLLPANKGNIPIFLKKLNGGFAMYFNLKHNRKGALFGSRYKSVLIKTDHQMDSVSRYVSIINPLDIYQPGWRENGLINRKEALKFLENYPFSSFPDKIGKRKSCLLAPDDIMKKYSLNGGNGKDYMNFAKNFLEQRAIFIDEIE